MSLRMRCGCCRPNRSIPKSVSASTCIVSAGPTSRRIPSRNISNRATRPGVFCGTRMGKELQELKDRLVKLSDEQLIEMVLAPPGEYRQDALDIAKAELKWRRVEIPEPEEPEATSDPVSDDPLLSRLGPARGALPENVCLIWGGRLRA